MMGWIMLLVYPIHAIYGNTITHPSNTICNGKSITLKTDAIGDTYLWSTGETTNSITVTPSESTQYTCIIKKDGSSQDTGNLISLGGFEFAPNQVNNNKSAKNNIGATVNYEYMNFDQSGKNIAIGAVTTAKNANDVKDPYFVTLAPHSGNYMLVCDGGNSSSARVWQARNLVSSSMPLQAGTTYEFSCWVANIDAEYSKHGSASLAKLKFVIEYDGSNGAKELLSFTAPEKLGVWEQQSATFTPTNNSSWCNIWILNYTTVDEGNDFALDDIYFGTVISEEGSETTEHFPIEVSEAPTVSITNNDQNVCAGESTEIAATITGDYTSISWQKGNTELPDFAGKSKIEASANTQQGTQDIYTVSVNSDVCPSAEAQATITSIDCSPEPVIIDHPEIKVCIGESINLTAETAGNSYLWTTGETSHSITVSPSDESSVQYSCTVTKESVSESTGNLITLGGFEFSPREVSNNMQAVNSIGAMVQYSYLNFEPSNTLFTRGDCVTTQNPHEVKSYFSDMTAHSGNYMLMCDGGKDADAEVWSAKNLVTTESPLKAGAQYEFSCYIANIDDSGLFPDAISQIKFVIETEYGISTLAEFKAPTTPGIWEIRTGTFTPNQDCQKCDIYIVNINTALNGNDFALDDIYFGLDRRIPAGTTIENFSVKGIDCSPEIINLEVCAGESIKLNDGDPSEYLELEWESTDDPSLEYLSDSRIASPEFKAPMEEGLYTYTITGKSMNPVGNLIKNGDFEQGNSGFISEYIYSEPGPRSIYNEGVYSVADYVPHPMSECKNDHTSGSGLFMSVNGSSDNNAIVWEQIINNIQPNTDYTFTAWVMCWDEKCENPAILNFTINGEKLDTRQIQTIDGSCQWNRVYAVWQSEDFNSATIRLVNTQTEISGNDFAIDDIFFTDYTSINKIFNIHVKECIPAVQYVAHENLTLCNKEEATLQAETKGNKYIWGIYDSDTEDSFNEFDNTEENSPIYVVPAATGTYNYICKVYDKKNYLIAEETFPVTGEECPILLLSEKSDNTICEPSEAKPCNGTANVTASGGVPPYTYLWDNGESVNNISGLCNGIYTVTVTDAVGTTESINVEISTIGELSVNIDTTLCAGELYEFFGEMITEAGEYSHTETNETGCTVTTDLTVTYISLENTTLSGEIDICAGENTILSVKNYPANSKFTWEGCEDITQDSPIITVSPSADCEYTVTISAGRCSTTLTKQVYVHDIPQIKSIISESGSGLNIELLAVGGSSPYTFIFDNMANNDGIFNNVGSGYHQISLIDNYGCAADSTIFISLPLIPDKFFTPNGDGVNDLWTIKNIETEPSYIYIFDRFDRKVAEFNPYDFHGWDGNYNGHQMPSADYWYLIRSASTGKSMHGHFTLHRGR